MSQFIETHKYSIETISPIHIGSGEKLLRTDYVIYGGKLYAINMDRLIGSLKAEQVKIFSQLIQKGDISIALRSLNIKPSEYNKYAKYVIPCEFQLSQELQTHIKDIEYKPYIPGSSIKGAIRTAICYYLFNNPKNKEWLIREIKNLYKEKKVSEFIESIFGSEDRKRSPHHDVMKFLRVSDSKSLGLDSLKIQEMRLINGISPAKYKIGRRIYAETIKPGFGTFGKLTLDKMLYQETYSKYADKFLNYKISTDINTIISCVNKFASDLIDKEREFASNHNIYPLQNFYSDLMKNHKEKLGKNQLLLRIGWGSGYLATTLGMLLQNERWLFERIRRYLRLGKPFSPISRKLITEQDVFMPLGWVKVTIE